MGALSDETGTLKFVHTYGVGLHSGDIDPDVHDPRWQQRQGRGTDDARGARCRAMIPALVSTLEFCT